MLGVVLGRLQKDPRLAGAGDAGPRLRLQRRHEGWRTLEVQHGPERGAQVRAERVGDRFGYLVEGGPQNRPRVLGGQAEGLQRLEAQIAEPGCRHRRGRDAQGDVGPALARGQRRPGPPEQPCRDRAVAAGGADPLEIVQLEEKTFERDERGRRGRLRLPPKGGRPHGQWTPSQSSSMASWAWKACSGPWPFATIGALKNSDICSCTPPSPRLRARSRTRAISMTRGAARIESLHRKLILICMRWPRKPETSMLSQASLSSPRGR